MNKCIFYQGDKKEISSNELSSNRQLSHFEVKKITYCTHPDAFVDREVAHTIIGGAKLLKCNGDPEHCPIVPS